MRSLEGAKSRTFKVRSLSLYIYIYTVVLFDQSAYCY